MKAAYKATERPAPKPKPARKRKVADEKDDEQTERKRARHPAGDDLSRGGQFIGDDPATPEDEAWVE